MNVKNVNLSMGGVLGALAGVVGGMALGISLGLNEKVTGGMIISALIAGAHLGNKIWDSVFGGQDAVRD